MSRDLIWSLVVGFFSIVGVLLAIQKAKKKAIIPIIFAALIVIAIIIFVIPSDPINPPEPDYIIQTLTEAFPEQNAKLHEFSTSNSAETISTYAGPGKDYTFIEKIKPAAQYATTICFIENNWALAHLVLDKYDRYVYVDATKKNNGYTNIDDINISYPHVSALKSVNGIINNTTSPKWGPGNGYETVNFSISQGATVKVLFKENGYYYIEYDQTAVKARVWIPESSVSVK